MAAEKLNSLVASTFRPVRDPAKEKAERAAKVGRCPTCFKKQWDCRCKRQEKPCPNTQH